MSGKRIVIAASWLGWFSVFLARSAPSPVLILIERDYSISHGTASLIFTSYLLAYAAMQIPSGVLSDRVGAPRVIAAGLTIMALSCLAMGLSPTFAIMAVLSFLAGIGAGTFYTSSTSLISTVFPPGERGRVLGIAFSGMNVGGSVAIALGALGSLLGWRGVLFISAIPGILGAVLFTRIKIPGPGNLHRDLRSALGLEVLRAAAVPLYIAIHALMLITYFSIASFTPTYIASTSSVGLAEANLLFLVFPLSGILGGPLGGYMADRLGPRRVLMISLASISVGTMAIPFIKPEIYVVIPLIMVGLMSPAVGVTLPLLVVEKTPSSMRGAVLGWFNSGSFVGGSVGPYIFGFVADLYGFPSSYLAVSLAPLIAVPLLYIARAGRGVRDVGE